LAGRREDGRGKTSRIAAKSASTGRRDGAIVQVGADEDRSPMSVLRAAG
jgi:hypothetical protein